MQASDKENSTFQNLLGRRLRIEMQLRGLTAVDLARRAEVKNSFVYDILSGKSTNPSTFKLARVATSLGISLSDLVGDAGGQPGGQKNCDLVRLPYIKAGGASGEPAVTDASGAPYYSFHRGWIQDHLRTFAENLRLLSISGDSMAPTLSHDDTVLVDISRRTPSPPGIFVLFDGFGLIPKRLEYLADSAPARIRVIADNPQYRSCDLLAQEVNIVGRVVWFAREI